MDTIGLDNFPAFLRHYWISKHKLVRQEYLFRAIKEVIKTSPKVIELLDELEKNAQLYSALSNSSDPFWIGQRNLRKRIREIELFKEKQALPLLLASYNNLTGEEFTSILRVVSVITFRYTIIGGLRTNLKEDIYNKAAIKVSRKELTNASSIAQEIKALYTTDKDFKNDFSTIQVSTKRNKKLVRYILFEIENHVSQTDTDYEDSPATIEHILPENASDDWSSDFPISLRESLIYRFGNYTLLEDDKNRACGTKDFEAKKTVYQSSQYAITKQVVSIAWTPNTLDNRQSALANYASAVWRLPYFD